jgi:hypothetical protein
MGCFYSTSENEKRPGTKGTRAWISLFWARFGRRFAAVVHRARQ